MANRRNMNGGYGDDFGDYLRNLRPKHSGDLRVRKDVVTGMMWFVDEYIGPSPGYPGKWVRWLDGPADSFLTAEDACAAAAKAKAARPAS